MDPLTGSATIRRESAPVMNASVRQRAKPYIIAYAGLLAVALAPVWLVTMPPLADYPNHLARMHILMHARDSVLLSEFYQVHWALIPNLAMDLLVPPMAHLMPLESAGKAFVSLTLILLSSGALALHYALYRKFSPLPLAVFLLLYNGFFLLGILNFLFGLGVALWGLAAWVYLPARRAGTRALLFLAMCLVLFVSHLSALGVFALCVIGFEVRMYRERRDSVRPARAAAWVSSLALCPGLLVFFFSLGSADTAGAEPMFRYDYLQFIPLRKILASLLVFGNYADVLDAATGGVVLWGILYAAMARRLSLDRRISGPLAVLAVAFLLMPFQAFGSDFADSRILVAVAFLFAASFDLRPRFKYQRTFALGLLAIFGVRMAVIAEQWRQSENTYAEYVRAVDQVPEGSRLLALWIRQSGKMFEQPLAHLASLAVIRKSAFLPSTYATPRGQPIVFTPAYRSLADQAPKLVQQPGATPAWDKVLDQYDYVLLVREHRFSGRPPAVLSLVYEGADFRLYRTPRASRAAALKDRPV